MPRVKKRKPCPASLEAMRQRTVRQAQRDSPAEPPNPLLDEAVNRRDTRGDAPEAEDLKRDGVTDRRRRRLAAG